MTIKRFCILAIILFTAAVVGSRWLPWWGAVLLIPGVILFIVLSAVWLVKRWWRRGIAASMEEAGRALRGAEITIHSVTVAEPPPNADSFEEFEDDEEAGGEDSRISRQLRRQMPVWYASIDMTVAPPPEVLDPVAEKGGRAGDEEDGGDGADLDSSWQPAHFVLVPFDSHLDPDRPRLTNMYLGRIGNSHHVELLDDRGEVQWTTPPDVELDEEEETDGEGGPPIRGRRRARIIFGIPADMPRRVKLRYLLEEFGDIELPEPPFEGRTPLAASQP